MVVMDGGMEDSDGSMDGGWRDEECSERNNVRKKRNQVKIRNLSSPCSPVNSEPKCY